MLLEAIKSQTQRLHTRVEADLGIMDDAFTIEDYRRLLGRFLGFIGPWEDRLRGTLGIGAPVLVGREKASRLERDLRSLGMPDHEIASLPRCDEIPVFGSVESALGSLYVFEGATLGGQVIARRLGERFGPLVPCGFFNSYGEDVGRMWKAFRETLLEYSSAVVDPVIIGSAIDTFDRFGRWLEGRRP
jgi:heme oxygenase